MKNLKFPAQLATSILLLLNIYASSVAAQTTEIKTEYLMTLYAPLEVPQLIDDGLSIYNVREGGWVKGPKISGKLLAPSADWLRLLPGGGLRLDVRATIETDDGALVYISYNGVIHHTEESAEKMAKGETLSANDFYFVTAPTMRTSSEKYAWLNHVQCIGKVVEVKAGDGSFVKYDIFIAR